MLKLCFAGIVWMSAAGACFAQMTPVGIWQTLDDKTKEAKSEVQITETSGLLNGKVVKLLRKDAKQDAVCDECSDDRKGKPVLGMEILRGVKKVDGKDVWEDGKVLDPENGKTYAAKLTPIEGGKKLEMRGSVGPFGRTQTWVRVQ